MLPLNCGNPPGLSLLSKTGSLVPGSWGCTGGLTRSLGPLGGGDMLSSSPTTHQVTRRPLVGLGKHRDPSGYHRLRTRCGFPGEPPFRGTPKRNSDHPDFKNWNILGFTKRELLLFPAVEIPVPLLSRELPNHPAHLWPRKLGVTMPGSKQVLRQRAFLPESLLTVRNLQAGRDPRGRRLY